VRTVRGAARALPFDVPLVVALALLAIFGLVVLASASSVTAYRTFGSSFSLFNRQLISYALGLALFVFAVSVDYRRWRAWSFGFLIAVLALLVLVLMPGIGATLHGAQRWIHLGPLFFQPSEPAKLALILALALWIEREGGRSLQGERALPFLVPVALVGALVLAQPDFGSVVILTLIALALYLTAGAPLKQLASLGAVLLVLGIIAIAVQPYRLERFKTFFNPEADPRGSGYHVTQSVSAIAAGGWTGRGYGESIAKNGALPEPESDSIFAVAVEELGAGAAVGFVALYTFIGIRGLMVARRAPDAFGRNVAIGITVWVVGQAFVNIGALTGTLPLTGVTLPLVSYGGSSLITTLAALGILVNVSRASRMEPSRPHR
jgi:cell division protein FtsW